MQPTIRLFVIGAAFLVALDAQAQNEETQAWPRFHLGAAVGGSSGVKLGWPESGLPERFWGANSAEPDSAQKIMAGYRPLRFVGVELQLIDLGDASTSATGGMRWGGGQVDIIWERSSTVKASADAKVLSALLFVPETLAFADVYGKLGVARLDETVRAGYREIVCVPMLPSCIASYDAKTRQSDSRPFLGVGARFKVAPAVSLLIEYESIDRDVGDGVAMWSVGAAWEH